MPAPRPPLTGYPSAMGNWSYSGGFAGTGAGGGRGGGTSSTATMPRSRSPWTASSPVGSGLGQSAGASVPTTTPSTDLGSVSGSLAGTVAGYETSPAGNGGVGSYADLFGAMYGPEKAANDLDYQFALNKIGYAQEGNALDAASMKSDYGYDLASLGIKDKQLGLDRASINLDMERAGIGRRENESERDYIDRMKQYAAQLNAQNVASINFEGQDKARSIKSGYTTGGTLFAPGHTYDQNANALRTAAELEQERIGYGKTLEGLDRDYRSTLYDDERLGLSERESQLAAQKLDLMASQLGIDRARLASSLESGLAKLGLDGRISIEALIAGAADVNGANSELYRKIISDAIAMGLEPGDVLAPFLPPSVPLYPHSSDAAGSSGGGWKHY